MTRTLPLTLCLALLFVPACGDKDDTALPEGDTDTDTDSDSDSDSDSDADSDTDADTDTGAFEFGVSGTVSRSSDPLEGGTTGLLCLMLADECPSMSNLGAIKLYDGSPVADISIPDLDTPVDFEGTFNLESIPDAKSFVVAAYFETGDSACDEGGPSYGELITFGDDDCPPVTLTHGEDIEGVVLDLNFAMPY